MKRLFVLLTCWRFVLHWMYYKSADNGEVIKEDLLRNIKQFLHKENGI